MEQRDPTISTTTSPEADRSRGLNEPTARSSSAPVTPLTRDVLAISRRMRMLMVVGAWSTLFAMLLTLIAVAAGFDAAIRFPWVLRFAFFVLILFALWRQLRRRVFPAMRVVATPVEVAVRIERMRPELAGRLVPAVEFDLSGAVHSSVLAERAVRDAEQRAAGLELHKVIRYQPTVSRALVFLSVLSCWVIFTIATPESAAIALRRMLTPWSDVSWPARTAIESLVQDGVVAARGRPFALRARLVAGDAETERVRALYRVTPQNDGATDLAKPQSESVWEEIVLSRQPNGDFERLVDASGEGLEVRFESSDSATAVIRVRFVDPPTIESASLSVQPPAYVGAAVPARNEELGNGTDARSILREPILEGSDVRIEMQLNRAVSFKNGQSVVRVIGGDASTSMANGGSNAALADGATNSRQAESDRIGETASGDLHANSQQLEFGYALIVDENDPTRWSLSGRANESIRVEVTLVDGDGISQDEPIAFAFEVTADRVPTATLMEPEQDESVLPDARIALRAESRDDLGLRSAGIEISTRLGKEGLESLVFEEIAPVLKRSNESAGGSERVGSASVTVAETERLLDLSTLSVKAGDVIVLRAFGEDFLDRRIGDVVTTGEASNSTAGIVPVVSEPVGARVRSAARLLRIVGADEFERQIRSSLAGVRRDAMRLDERQAKARDVVERNARDDNARDAQGVVTEGLSRTAEALQQLKERLARNGEEEGVLAEIAQQAEDLVEVAQAKSSQASESLERVMKATTTEAASEATVEATGAQESVREELEDLVSLLDRNEDAWVARKRLDELTNKVKQLTRETEQAATRSNGESREELSAEARAELDALAERQQQASDESEQVAQDLRERAKALEQADRQQAKALEDAAKAIDDGRVRDELKEAANSAQENRLEESKGAQQRASEALSKAAEALEMDNKVRAEELARELESLTDSIRRLLDEAETLEQELQQIPIEKDDSAVESRDGLARSIGLLSQNTRGTASDARSMSREAARAARFLDDAASDLAKVSTQLRIDPYPQNDAESSMDAAQKALEDALAAAEEAQDRAEERAEEEKRDELLVKYRDFLEREASIRGATERIVRADGARLARRELIESRRLGTVQEELRAAIDALRKAEPEIQDSDALMEMHDIIESSLQDARVGLSEGRPIDAIPVVDEALEALGTIVAALEESEQPDDDRFEEAAGADGSGAGGSGGGPQGAVPPVAEIKILKSLQESLARQTRRFFDGMEALDPVVRSQRLAELAAKQQRIVELGSKIAEKLGSGRGPTVEPTTESKSEQPSGGASHPPMSNASPSVSSAATNFSLRDIQRVDRFFGTLREREQS